MEVALILIVLAVLVIAGSAWWSMRRAALAKEKEFADAQAEARRWVERLGGQVLHLIGTNDAAKQALADAAERHTAAGAQMDQANSAQQCGLTTQTALEGLYYVRAARTAMDMDPGPELPDLTGQRRAGKVTEYRDVEVEGERHVASPSPTEQTPHYYPGGRVAGRPVPQGWYSQPWWKPALVAGTWGVGSFMLTSALLGGMTGVPAEAAYSEGFADGQAGADAGDPGMGDGVEDPGMGGFDFGGFDGFGF